MIDESTTTTIVKAVKAELGQYNYSPQEVEDIMLTITTLTLMFRKSGAPMYDRLFIEALRRTSDIYELCSKETK